jgi:predicted Zn finger-like uncharacterized protein
MIIQCRKCETRFRFDDQLIEGDGVWVRCSRCQHVFFQDRPAAVIPSVRVSDARRTPEDRFPAAEERRPPMKSDSLRPAPLPEVDEAQKPSADFTGEPSLNGMDEDLDKEPDDGPAADAGQGEEAVEAAGEDAAAGRKPGRWGRMMLKVIALVIFIALVAGTVYLYLFPEVRGQLLEGVSPWLRGVPLLEDLVATDKGGGSFLAPVRLREVRQRSVANLLAGNLRVIEGVAMNQTSHPLSRIKVRLVISDAYDVVLGEKIVYCGNILTDAELAALAESEIQRELSIPQGSDVPNERVAPKAEIPFMIVFSQEQAGAIKTTMSPAGADRVP